MSAPPVTISVRDRIAYIELDHPPVNGLAHAVRVGLVQAFARASADAAVDAIVLHGVGKGFSAGGDIREFGTPHASAAPGLSRDVHPAIETCGKTVVAAIHGYALGGGLETAMTCHRRVATPDAKLGLPEVRIGVVPLSGTQRLPRLVGLTPAIEMIVGGEPVAGSLLRGSLIDVIASPDDLLLAAAQLARAPAPALARDIAFPREGAPALLASARDRINAGEFPAFAHHLIDAIAAGADASDFDAGLQAARAIYESVIDSAEGKAARAAFLSRRASIKDVHEHAND